jgi:PPOX class probable F420-dependent enzyme
VSAPAVPDGFERLLTEPSFAHLATVREDGSPQSNVMWFAWDGELFRFTHTSRRRKFRNVRHEPRVAFSIADGANGYRYLEVRGEVVSVEPDDEAANFFRSLMTRYGQAPDGEVPDADVRVVITVRPGTFVAVDDGRELPRSARRSDIR